MNKKTNCIFKLSIILLCIMIIFTTKGWSQQAINLSLDYSQATALQKKVYGYNDEHTNKPYYSTNSTFKSIYNKLGKPTFRYPAGTASNYLNLYTGFAEGWDSIDLDLLNRRVNTINNSLENKGKGEKGQDWRELAKFIKSENAVATYIVNLSTMSLNENKQVLQGIKDMGATINHFEIGNEVFFAEYKTPFPDAAVYLSKAEEASEMIKTIFPDAKIALALPAKFYTEESFLDGPAPDGNRLEQWYETIMTQETNMTQDWYDALAVHLYAETGMNSEVKSDNFLPYEESYTYGISHNDNRLQDTFDRLKTDFPNKKIWVTEYHTGGFRGDVRNYNLRLSYLGALFNANFMMKLFSNPQIELSNWHSFQQWLDFDKKYRELVPDNFEYKELVNLTFFKMFRKPVKNSTQFIKTQIQNSKKYTGPEKFPGSYNEVDAGTFYNPDTKEGFTIIFNKKGSTYTLGRDIFENSVGGKILEIIEVSPRKGPNLMNVINDTLEVTRFQKSRSIIDPVDGNYGLRPYSMYVVHYKRTNINPTLTVIRPTSKVFKQDQYVPVKVEATDEDGTIEVVRLFLDGVQIGADREAPYKWIDDDDLKGLSVGNHKIRVTAVDNDGGTAFKIITFEIKPAAQRLSALDTESVGTIIVSPNPVFDSHVTIYQKGNENLSLYNTAGKELWKLNIDADEFTLDVSDLSDGMYILKSNTASTKFIVK